MAQNWNGCIGRQHEAFGPTRIGLGRPITPTLLLKIVA